MNTRSLYRTAGLVLPIAIEGAKYAFSSKEERAQRIFQATTKIRSFFDPSVRVNPISLFSVAHAEGIDFSLELKNALEEIQKNPINLSKLSPRMQNNEKVVLAAVQQDGLALQFASKEMQNNGKVVLVAVQQDGLALQFASKEMQNNGKVVLAALRQDADAYKYVGESLRSDPDVLRIVREFEPLPPFSVESIREGIEDLLLRIVRGFEPLPSISVESIREGVEDLLLRIVRGFEPLPSFSVESIRGGIEDLLMNGDSTIGLFSSEQIHKDGAVDLQEVKMLLSNLKVKAKEGIYFTDPESNNLNGGTCSAMTSMLINEIFPQKIRTLQELEEALKKISTKSSLQRCITQSCESARDLQMAFNAIRISPNHKGSRLDFSKHKIESLAGVYQMSIGKTSEPLKIRSIQAPDNFKQVIDKLPEGIYWLRAINKADNEKLENFGHSLMFIKGKDFLGLYDPSVGMKIASLRNAEGFIKDAVLFSLRRYVLHEARFYEIIRGQAVQGSSIQVRSRMCGIKKSS
jgi:hypothetical protein